jgi:phosphatidylinositol alpha-mannosyltransferase
LSDGLRIALLAPTYWPEVRRGSERVVHDLGTSLAARGHDVTLLTTQDGPGEEARESGMRVVRSRRLPQPPGMSAYEYHLTNVPGAFARLVRGGYDVAQSFFPAESWAAVAARRFGGPPVVATTHGIPAREYLVARRYRLAMHLRIAREADACAVLSEAAAEPYERYLLRRPAVLPGGVMPGAFDSDAPPASRPTLFCASSLGDPRKQPELLFAAFGRLRAEVPEARLRIARPRDPFMSGGLPALPEGAEWVSVDDERAMAEEYAGAWASVNPAVGEAFGLVLVESLAAGTPAVGDRSGAAPEILDDDVGRLFEPGDEAGLARALREALELGVSEKARAACRERADDYAWPTVVERYEELHRRVAGSH